VQLSLCESHDVQDWRRDLWPKGRPGFVNLQIGGPASSSLLELGALLLPSGASPVASRRPTAKDLRRKWAFWHLRSVPRWRRLEDAGSSWWRHPGLDCVPILSSRVFFVRRQVLS
jgi:hypothetical protein